MIERLGHTYGCLAGEKRCAGKTDGCRQSGGQRMNAIQNWSSLAAAVVNMAIRDMKNVRAKVKVNPDNKVAKAELEELEMFFRSEWFRILLTMSGVEADEKIVV